MIIRLHWQIQESNCKSTALATVLSYFFAWITQLHLPLLLTEGCCIDLEPPFAEVLLTPPLHGEVEHGPASSFTTAAIGDAVATLGTEPTTFCWHRILVVTSATWRHGVELPPELHTGSFLICNTPPFGHSETELPFPPALSPRRL
jgi:hypothetical protein